MYTSIVVFVAADVALFAKKQRSYQYIGVCSSGSSGMSSSPLVLLSAYGFP